MSGMRDRDRGEWIPWYCDDSPGWLELSLAARGAAEGIARKMGRSRGELHLGSRGLKGLAVLLRCSWEELEPAIRELTEGDHPRFIVSEDQRVLIDPEHESRRRPTSADRVKKHRNRSKSDQVPDSDVTPVTVTAVTEDRVTHVTGASVSSPLLSSDLKISDPDQNNLTGGSSADPPPKWFGDLVAAIELQCVVDLRVPDCWLRYAGHRESKSEEDGRPRKPSPGDARYWLTTVMVPEARKEVQAAARQRERDARFKDHTPKYEKPTGAQSKSIQQQLAERIAAEEAAKKGAA